MIFVLRGGDGGPNAKRASLRVGSHVQESGAGEWCHQPNLDLLHCFTYSGSAVYWTSIERTNDAARAGVDESARRIHARHGVGADQSSARSSQLCHLVEFRISSSIQVKGRLKGSGRLRRHFLRVNML